MSYTNGLDKPSDYFRIKLYAGNATNNRAITWEETDTNMQPNMLWFKSRTDTQTHGIFDSVRSAIKRLIPSSTAAEGDEAADLDSFDTNGFTVDAADNMNGSSRNFVTWGWKAGTSFTNDASGTGIGSIDSAGSVNQDAGFSIVSYTNTNQSANSGVATIKHGLNTTPNVMILKDRDATSDWSVYHSSLPTNKYLALNKNDAGAVDTNIWNNTAPTSTVFTVGDNSYTNPSNRKMIGYIFAEKKGYSKFGSYTGNGNADGTFVYTGFKPAYVMVKRTDSTVSWTILDNKRDPFNVTTERLFPNENVAGSVGTNANTDFLSNGFKIRVNHNNFNTSGGTYIYMAFAKNPFVTSTGVPATAR